MASPELELQGAIYATLSADVDLVALGSGVYDIVPRDAPLPYVTIGPMFSGEQDADCIDTSLIDIQIDCWSQSVGFPEVKQIAHAVRRCLHDADLDLPTNGLVMIEHSQSRFFRDPDGLTSHAAVEFVATVERTP
jgi:hypothetical protein